MSSLFGSSTIEGNRLTDMPVQTCAVGIPIPFVYGTAPVNGNLGWAGELHEHVAKKKQGKGGVKTTEYTYTISYAVFFGRGPIYGYLTIKRDGKVVYTTDPNATVEDKDYAAKWLQKATLYLGSSTQMPDSTIEAQVGVGQVSAFRRYNYIVVEEDDVTPNGGAVPNYEAVIIANSIGYVTSEPYVVEVPVDSYDRTGVLMDSELRDIIQEADAGIESYDRTGVLLDSTMRDVVHEYTVPPEGYDRTGALRDSVLDVVVTEYTSPPEGYDRTGALRDSTLDEVVIEYTSPQDQYRRTGALQNGTLI